MSDSRVEFYRRTIAAWIADPEATVLIVAAGSTDYQVFSSLGFTRVTISNMDTRMTGSEFGPFSWSFQNAEQLEFADGSFDYVIVHAGLHHLSSPHRGLTEMYRVARLGAGLFEARDSSTMRWMLRMKLTHEYEHAAVFHNGGRYGGVNNTGVPNYVFRWTEREIEKTIASYAPALRHRFRVFWWSCWP